MTQKVLKLALEALKFAYNHCDSDWVQDEKINPAITAIKEALAQTEQECNCSQGQLCRVCDPDVANGFEQPKQEPVAHSVIAGVLFDFMGWLTSRKERIVLSSANEASPAVDAIRDFAKMRGLSLDDAKVLDWNTTPPQRTWQGLTDEEIDDLWEGTASYYNTHDFARAIEAKLKELNT